MQEAPGKYGQKKISCGARYAPRASPQSGNDGARDFDVNCQARGVPISPNSNGGARDRPREMAPKDFFAELRRRNVYRVAVTYALIAWLLIQATSILSSIFDVPPWVMKVVVIAIAFGFPIALILAWAFEITPEGLKRTEDIPDESIAPKTDSRWSLGGIGIILLGVALEISDYKSLPLAICLAVIAICLLLPSLKGKGKIAWDAGKRVWAESDESNPILLKITAILLAMALGGALFGAIWWGLKSAYSIYPAVAETKPSASSLVTPSRHEGVSAPAINPKSIAVLPLQNLSDDKKEAYFAIGLQEDVITRLAKLKGIRVVPRRWLVQYEPNIPPNLPELRQVFGVAHILVGSVRHAGDRVFVSVQLIDTANGQHIWAEPYARTLADSISLQGELASEIAGQLHVILSPDEKKRVQAKPTNDPDAWVFYLRGRDVHLRPETSRANFLSAESFYRQAIALDPDFVLALAQLSLMQAQRYQFFDRENETLIDEARENAEEALRLDPYSAEGHLARARCAQMRRDHRLTRSDLSAAVRLRPDDGSIRLAAAVIQQQLGWEEEASANYRRAVELGPRAAKIFLNHGYLLYQIGQEAEARWAMDQALLLEPDSVYFRLVRAFAEISWTGETARARAILTRLPAGQDPDGRVTSAHCTLAIFERNFPEALRLLRDYSGETLPSVDTGGLGQQDRKIEGEGTIRLYAGDRARAYECFDSVRWHYEVGVRENQESAIHRAALAVLYAWMGWKEPALAEAARALELEPSAGGAVKRGVTLGLAKAYTWAGEPDLALRQLEQFFRLRRSDYTVHNFRLDPIWDPLRNDPRFEELLAKQK